MLEAFRKDLEGCFKVSLILLKVQAPIDVESSFRFANATLEHVSVDGLRIAHHLSILKPELYVLLLVKLTLDVVAALGDLLEELRDFSAACAKVLHCILIRWVRDKFSVQMRTC